MKEHMYVSGGGTLQNRKGFTLIELLAVIVILAIIALITTPIVLNIINDVKENSNINSVDSIARAADLYYTKNAQDSSLFPKIITLPDEENVLELHSAENISGYVTISKRGEVEVKVNINNNEYAKNYSSKKIYNTKDEEYMYVGHPDEWIVSINNPNKLIMWKPPIFPDGTSEIITNYIWIPYYYYTETNDYFFQDISIEKQDTIDKTIKNYYQKYPGIENYISIQLQEEMYKYIKMLKANYGESITDSTLIDCFDYDEFDESVKNDIPIIYKYIHDPYQYDRIFLNNEKEDITITIPSEINGHKITEIGEYKVGEDCSNVKECRNLYYSRYPKTNIYNVIIPEGIEKISGDMFSDSQVNKIKFPSTLKSVSYFNSNSLEELNLPEGLQEIGLFAFADNRIKKLNIPSTVTIIRENAFADNLIKEITIPSNVISIGARAFSENELEKIILNEGLQEIGWQAFNAKWGAGYRINKIKEVTIPSTVVNIHDGAFSGNPIEKVTIKGDKTRFNDVWTDIGFPAELMPTE